jgi:glucokinase
MSEQYALGVDIGGTKISVVLGNSRGKILAKIILPTLTGRKSREGITRLAETLKHLKRSLGKRARLAGVGVGIPGPMNPMKGVVQRSPHLGGWEGFPLKRYLERAIKARVVIHNDANTAALGERVFGGGKRTDNFAYLTISTGIGGGLVANGRLIEGSSFVGGEVGHMTIVPNGERCKCGKHGCLEAYASGTAIARYVEGEMRRGRPSRIRKYVPKKEKLEARHVGLAARSGDRLAVKAYGRGGFYLGIGIANLLNILNPERVILGGGVLKSAPPAFWKSMQKSLKREAWPQAFRSAKVVKTRLNNRAGDLGALALVFLRPS